ncbi:hypothetical protein [Lactococcus termiticola]|uniref:Uncharacterized protein n=1 Tax=Lactococcus termiticola TaxID=2169526 RepID=A0A2R5HEH0_9LACT|nr:hypothetical protein [Lactococcus termiticola]GBG96439.1 hypothetical protein NtB2_00551 [Lactococcus termiticola]
MLFDWVIGLILLAMGVFYLVTSGEERIRQVLEQNRGQGKQQQAFDNARTETEREEAVKSLVKRTRVIAVLALVIGIAFVIYAVSNGFH